MDKIILVGLLCLLAAVVHGNDHSKGYHHKRHHTEYAEKRILRGTRGVQGQFPWVCYLNGVTKNNDSFGCGGTLINEEWVLTAAHCVTESASDIDVHIGGVTTDPNEPGKQVFKSKSIIVHEDYARPKNDLALIGLSSSVKLDAYAAIAKLPQQGEVTGAGVQGVICGWGSESAQITARSPYMKYINATVTTEQVCKDTYGKYYYPEIMCAGSSEWEATCTGDSGGGLVTIDNNGICILIGILNFGKLPCEDAYPQVYARSEKYLPWINQKTGLQF